MSVRSNVHIVVLLVLAMGALLPTAAGAQERLWFDVNIGGAVPTEQDFSTSSPTSAQPPSLAVDYSAPTGVVFDVGAGFLLTPQFGVGVSVSSSKHSDVPFLSVTVPHPVPGFPSASDTAEGSPELERTETSLHLQAMLVPLQDDSNRFRIFGGPTYMRVEQETVARILFTQTANSVEITGTGYEPNSCECTGWGFNVGADYSYFFNPNVGVGGVLRYTRVKVEPIDYSGSFDINAGGVAFGAGLRVKF